MEFFAWERRRVECRSQVVEADRQMDTTTLDSFADMKLSTDSPNPADCRLHLLNSSSSISKMVVSGRDNDNDTDQCSDENQYNLIVKEGRKGIDDSRSFIVHSIGRPSEYPDIDEPRIRFNMGLSWRLKSLEYKAMYIQYQLACLSTLGGAYHLINCPKAALSTALQQERVAALLGSTALLVRARVFQATNYHLLGLQKRARRAFRGCKLLVQQYGMEGGESAAFILASEEWCQRNTKNAQLSVT